MADSLPELPPRAFAKADPSPDTAFYAEPRFVTHIDDGAISAVTGLYRRVFPAGGAVLVQPARARAASAPVHAAARRPGRGVRDMVLLTSSQVKPAAVEGYGGRITFCEPTLAAREAALREVVAETGAAFVHPYDDPRVIAGQGTAALELLEEAPNLDSVVVPVGGGGLMSGTAIAVTSLYSARVIGVEPEAADDARRSLEAGVILPSNDPKTIADGLRTSLGEIPFEVAKKRLRAIVTVSEEAIARAMRLVWERMKIIIEPSSAVPVAAVLEGKIPGDRIGVILSGGNVDLGKLPFTA